MLRFSAGTPSLGITITAASACLAVLSGRSSKPVVHSVQTIDLAPGMVTESFASQNIGNADALSALLEGVLSSLSPRPVRTSLSLPDGVFRVMTMEFDELPAKAKDRERLIRWKLEKTAAYDVSGTVLRYEVLRQRERGMTVLACLAKQSVLAEYESLLERLGLEVWHIGPVSFHILNLFAASMRKTAPGFALAHLTADTFAAIVSEEGGARFYRYKEVKRGASGDIRDRLVREIEDSLHFYSHRDRSETSEIVHLFLAGDPSLTAGLADELSSATSLSVHVLEPSDVASLPASGYSGDAWPAMAPAVGAGSMVL